MLTSPTALAPDQPAVISFVSTTGAQQLCVTSAAVASGGTTLQTAEFGFDQLPLGWGFIGFQPRASFGGHVYSAITGKGVPTAAEMQVMERYLASTASA